MCHLISSHAFDRLAHRLWNIFLKFAVDEYGLIENYSNHCNGVAIINPGTKRAVGDSGTLDAGQLRVLNLSATTLICTHLSSA